MKGKRKQKQWLILIVVAVALTLLVRGFFLLKNEPEELVEEFYSLEANGEFGQSWELFHSGMKKEFPNKSVYIQARAHVFMQDMEVETFKFKIGDSKKRKKWKMGKGSKTFKEVFEIPVTLNYESRFGKFVIEQNCLVVKEKGEWKLLWDYNF